jgi:NAD(P)-dependent dehydrogenase (short-subunit alcohol dehydrogenase family)
MAERPTAIVTGASRGIGKAIAVELASVGYDLVLNHFDIAPGGQPDESSAQQTQTQIVGAGTRCEILRADVGSAEARSNLVDFAKDKFGRCDLLANNAGVAPLKRIDILEATEESFDRVMGINLKGPYFLTQLVANWMIEQKKEHPDRKFRIVNIGSASAYTSSPSRGEYCVSKAGLSMMTKLYADVSACSKSGPASSPPI